MASNRNRGKRSKRGDVRNLPAQAVGPERGPHSDDRLPDPYPALLRAAERARQLAIKSGTFIILFVDGEVKRVAPEDLEPLA
jgi:hypothetical protein